VLRGRATTELVTATDDERARAAGDRGYTLVEVLVSLALMGMVISSILPAMWSAIRVSRFSDTQARVEAVLGSAVDRVSNFGWLPCPEADSTGGYAAKAKNASAIFEWPTSTVEVLEVQYWDTSTKSWSTVNPVPAGDCGRTVISITKERTLQKVTIKVTSPDGAQSNQLDLVMGDLRTDEERDATQA
jgi:prepilin-type N-terminal cleavage/methylation domain-containing protein